MICYEDGGSWNNESVNECMAERGVFWKSDINMVAKCLKNLFSIRQRCPLPTQDRRLSRVPETFATALGGYSGTWLSE